MMKLFMYTVGAILSLVVIWVSAYLMNTIEKYFISWWKKRDVVRGRRQ